MYVPMIKICCIMNRKELNIALDHGIRCVGFVSSMPSGPGIISDEEIKALAEYTPKDINTFLLTSLTDPEEISNQWLYCSTKTVQLCSPMIPDSVSGLRDIASGIEIVPVVHVEDSGALSKAMSLSNVGDGVLLDSGSNNSVTPRLGGTGETHNWNISKSIKENISKPLWLAGGLNSDNVVEAMDVVRPDGIDVCSGVRLNGALDKRKLSEFINAIHNYSSSL